MSELINTQDTARSLRRQLLITVSTLALIANIYGMQDAKASDDTDRPIVWIELGGQLSHLNDSQEGFSPPLMDARPSIFSPSQVFEKTPLNSIDETGAISFQPDGSDWVLSASVRYGRSASSKHVRQQTNPAAVTVPLTGVDPKYPIANKFADTNTQTSEHHFILDFQAGKDVGLGMFGVKNGSSVLNLGVRFAQFASKSNIALKSDPDWHFNYLYYAGFKFATNQPYHSNQASLYAERSFHGVGPSLSWNGSLPIIGNLQHSELTVDWGVNAALLFGRQRTKVHQEAKELYHPPSYQFCYECRKTTYDPPPVNLTRAKFVTVPNVGGFAGLSFKYSDAKISFGYRADFFFNAMDGGIDVAKMENVGFYGPFATISVGIGG